MAHHTEKAIKINRSAEKVLSDFGGIKKFAPTIKNSSVVSDIKFGVGAKRLCTFNDNSSLVEEIIAYQEGTGYKMKISEHSLPLKSMFAEMKVTKVDDNTCEVYMSADFVVKAGPVGWLLGHFIMRPVMKSVFKKVICGLAYHTKSGELIGEKLPGNEAVNKLVCT